MLLFHKDTEMALVRGGSDTTLESFFDGTHFLFRSFDVEDKASIVRRAIELQAFLVSLYYPRRSELSPSAEGHPPPVDIITLARRHAALVAYNHYTAPVRLSLRIKGMVSWKAVQDGLSINLPYIEILLELLRDYLAIERGGLSVNERGIPKNEYRIELLRQFEKARAVSTLIKAYVTNGQDIQNVKRRTGSPLGIKTLRNALCQSNRFIQTERTLANYFDELEPTAVFHYFAFGCKCEKILVPTDPRDPNFTQLIMQKARKVDELRAVCLHSNKIAEILNNKYGFKFGIVENIPQPEGETKYDSISRGEYDSDLAKAISDVIGHTE
jgi:hypothetical protein